MVQMSCFFDKCANILSYLHPVYDLKLTNNFTLSFVK